MIVYAHAIGLVFAVLHAVEPDRRDAQIGLLTIAALLDVGAIAGVRLILERSILTGWLLIGLIPSLAGAWVLVQRG